MSSNKVQCPDRGRCGYRYHVLGSQAFMDCFHRASTSPLSTLSPNSAKLAGRVQIEADSLPFGSPPRARDVLSETPLKEMNAAQLVRAIQYESEEAGLDLEQIDAAIDLAAILHARQTRRTRGRFTDTPYIEHPLRNALRLQRAGVTEEDVIVATILHDVIEDGAGNFVRSFYGKEVPEGEARVLLSDYIEQEFGPEPLRLVEAVTNDFIEDTADRPELTVEEKNRNYLEHVTESITDDPPAYLVKATDFIDNASGLAHSDIPGAERQTKKQATKYLPLVSVFEEELSNSKSYLDREGYEEIERQLGNTAESLAFLIEKYADLG